MGTSTDAILGWGVAYADQIYDEDEDEDGYGWRGKLTEEFKALGVEAGEHCSCECPQPYVFIAESVQRAWRGQVVDVAPQAPGADWGERIDKALALLAARFGGSQDGTNYDFATDQPRGWKLVAWWC